MRFGDPQAFWLLNLIPLLVVFTLWASHRKRRALGTFGRPGMVAKLTSATSRARQGVKAALVIGGFGLLSLALVQPQFGTKTELLHRRGVDIIIALDTSMSMLAEDISPNRLQRALYEIEGLIDRLQGDRIGLLAFAGKSFTLCPLTLDYTAAKLFLDAVGVDTIPAQGTAIAEAIRSATRSFGTQGQKYMVLILITDGEDHGGDPLAAAEEAATAGVRVYAVGVGTPEGELIPVRSQGRREYLKDRRGNIVKTRLDEATLARIAEITDGAYIRAQAGGVGVEEAYAQISQMEKRDLGSRRYTQYKHRYQWPLGLAFLCFVFEALLSDRRRGVGEWRGRFQE
ncbi:MAG: VWA domain-containing protein [Candidatus Latescibacteria bacterium]|nr:VWA domain-containing protein [Candidatus Latescibacterota bacterium]